MERSHTFALAKVNVSQIHYIEILFFISFRNTIAYWKAIVEISIVDYTQIKDLNNLCVRPTFIY